jgi:hypothetical protein
MLPVGKHELVIGSAELGFSETRTVEIGPGHTTILTVKTPEGKVNINARPWANVSVDGQAIGQTPLADVSLPVGRHEVVFQHPDFGERRETIIVGLKELTRVGVDFSR